MMQDIDNILSDILGLDDGALLADIIGTGGTASIKPAKENQVAAAPSRLDPVEGPIAWLPINVLSRIVEFMSVPDYAWNGQRKNAFSNPEGFFLSHPAITQSLFSIFNFRLVCKKWNKAACLAYSVWKRLLLCVGPSHIGPSSYHKSEFTRNPHKCRRSGKDNRCTVAAHYGDLEPNFVLSTPIDAYKECMKILGRKSAVRKQGRIKTLEKMQIQKEEKLRELQKGYKRTIKTMKTEQEDLKKALELDKKVYASHLKRKTAKKLKNK